MTKSSIKNNIIYSLVGILLIFILWFFFYIIVANNYLIPSPIVVIKQSFINLTKVDFYSHLLKTILRVLLALVISFIIGVSLAIISHLFKRAESVMLPLISVMRSIPILAILLIILVVVPRGVAPVIVCVLSVLPIVYSQTLSRLNLVSNKHKQMLIIYDVPIKSKISSVYFKGCTPFLIREITTLFSFSLKLIVSAEILANVYKSIGGDIFTASIYSNVAMMFSLTLIICLIGVLIEFLGNFIYLKMEKKYK